MKRKITPQYSSSKQVLNEFFHNSSDEDVCDDDEVDDERQDSENQNDGNISRRLSAHNINQSYLKSPHHQDDSHVVDNTSKIKNKSTEQHKRIIQERFFNGQDIIGSCNSSIILHNNHAVDSSVSISAPFEGNKEKHQEEEVDKYYKNEQGEKNQSKRKQRQKEHLPSIASESNLNQPRYQKQKIDFPTNNISVDKLASTRRQILRKELYLNQISIFVFGLLLLIKLQVIDELSENTIEQGIIISCILICLSLISIYKIMRTKQLPSIQDNVMNSIINQSLVNGKSTNLIINTSTMKIQGNSSELKSNKKKIPNFKEKLPKNKQIQASQSQDDLPIIKILILIGTFQFMGLIEAFRILSDIRSIILIFFIHQQLVLIYKLIIANMNKKVGFFLLCYLLTFAIIRSQFFYYFNEENNVLNQVQSFSFFNLIIEIIFCLSLFCQHFPVRMHTLSPFIANSQQAPQKMLNNISSFSEYNIKKNPDQEEIFLGQLKKQQNDQQNDLKMISDQEKHIELKESNQLQFEKNKQIRKMYQDILNVMPEGVALISSSGKLVYANKTLPKILQCQKNQILKILLNLATKPKQDEEETSPTQIFTQQKSMKGHSKSQRSISSSQNLQMEPASPSEKRSKNTSAKPSLFNRNRKISSPEIYIAQNSNQAIQNKKQQNSKRMFKTTPCDAASFTLNNDFIVEDKQTSQNAIQSQSQTNIVEQTQANQQQTQQPQLSDYPPYSPSIHTLGPHQAQNNYVNTVFNSKKTNEFSDVMSLSSYVNMLPGQQHQFQQSNTLNQSNIQEKDNNINNNNVESYENLVRKQKQKKFKNTEIIRQDINVKDILSSVFENLKSNQQDQDTKTAKTFKFEKKNSFNSKATKNQQPPKRQGSFFSQMKNQQNIGYFQYIDDKIKVEVEYNNTTLVLSMVMCEVLVAGYVEQLALILIDPLWIEMYEKKLSDMSQYRMKMFASLSHELRTPLNCSISMLQQLKNSVKEQLNCSPIQQRSKNVEIKSIKDRIKMKLLKVTDISPLPSINEKVKSKNNNQAKEWIEEYIDPALNSSNLLLNLINDILDFVQIDSGKFKFSFYKFDLEQLLANCVSMVGIQSKTSNRKVYLSLRYDENCPKIINSDPNRIRQIILNFLSNSLKFTSQGNITVTATLINSNQKSISFLPSIDSNMKFEMQQIDDEILQNPNNIIEIAVEDQGIGISQENIQNIFTAFNKIELGKNQTLNTQGCGLGLTISNSIAKGLGPLNQGGIRVKSEIGQGSIFSILVENREEGLQDHKCDEKEEFAKKMATINSQVETPISKYTKELQQQASSFFLIDGQYLKKDESQVQVKMNRISSNFTNKTSKTCKTSKSEKRDESCFVNDSEINRNCAQHFTPIQGFLIKEEELGAFGESFIGENNQHRNFNISLMKSSNNQEEFKKFNSLQNYENHELSHISYEQIKSHNLIQEIYPSKIIQQQYIQQIHEDTNSIQSCFQTPQHNSKTPLYKSQTIQSKTFYQIKTYESIKTEMKEISDAYASYDGVRTSKKSIQKLSSQANFSVSKLGMDSDTQLQASQKMSKISKRPLLSQTISSDKKKKIEGCEGVNDMTSKSSSNKLSTKNSKKLFSQKKKECICPEIMVADDNMFNQHALSMQLKTYGFKIEQACNGKMAIEMVQKRFNENSCCKCYKLIFMDIDMPIKNGYEAIQEIRQFFEEKQYFGKQSIVVACTAYISDEDKKKALSHGMDDFIKKPVFQEGLDLFLEQWFNIIFTNQDDDDEDEDILNQVYESIIENNKPSQK